MSAQTCQWSFRQIGTTGTLESRAGPNTGVGKNFEIVHEKSCTSSRPKKMVRSAVHNALLNILTMETPLPCVPAAFQQCAVAEINSNRPPLGHKSDVLLLYRLNKYFCPSAKNVGKLTRLKGPQFQAQLLLLRTVYHSCYSEFAI